MTYRLRDIEYFAEVAERGNVGRAAEALGLSQPALSKSLRRLQDSLRARLIKRLSKGVELTAVGKELYSHVQRLRVSLNDMTRAVADLAEGRAGHLRIRAGPSTGSYLVPIACAEFLKHAPDVTFNVTDTVVSERTLASLRNGELDLAVNVVSGYIAKDLVMEHLYDEVFGVCASQNHPLAQKKRVTLADLAQEKWIVSSASADGPSYLRRAFLDAALPAPRITMESSSMLMRNLLLANCRVLSFMPQIVILEAVRHHNLVALRVSGLSYARRMGVYYRKEAYLPPVARRFIDVLKRTASTFAPETP
jgi:DNA-binding transcriptional LysR family regulator